MKQTRLAGMATAALAISAFGLTASTAQADEPNQRHQWCPGQSMEWPTGPFNDVVWDMNVCHTWYIVDYQMGNLPLSYDPSRMSNIWEGENPPERVVRVCPPIAFLCPPPIK